MFLNWLAITEQLLPATACNKTFSHQLYIKYNLEKQSREGSRIKVFNLSSLTKVNKAPRRSDLFSENLLAFVKVYKARNLSGLSIGRLDE